MYASEGIAAVKRLLGEWSWCVKEHHLVSNLLRKGLEKINPSQYMAQIAKYAGKQS